MDDEELVLVVADVDCALEVEAEEEVVIALIVLVTADVDCALEVEVKAEEDVIIALVVDVDDELTVLVSLTDPLVVFTAAVAVARLVVDSSAEVVFPLSEPTPVLLLGDPAPTEDAKTFDVPAAVIVCRLEVEDAVVELP